MPSQPKIGNADYDAFWKSFAFWRKGRRWQEVETLIRFLTERTSVPNVLDVGCGSGRLLCMLEQSFSNGFSYLGIDVSEVLLSEAKNDNPDRVFVLGDARNLDDVAIVSEAGPFDAIFAVASFHHLLTVSDRKKALDGFARNLSPEGLLLMTNWNLLSSSNLAKYGDFRDEAGIFKIPFLGNSRAYFAFEPETLAQELRSAGWTVIDAGETERNLVTVAKRAN